MVWLKDNLSSSEALIHKGEVTKIGYFSCGPETNEFQHTTSLDNDVLVLPRRALQLQRNDDGFFFVEPGGVLLHRAGSELRRQSVDAHGDKAWWIGIRPDLFRAALSRCKLHQEDMGPALVLPPAFQVEILRLIALARRDSTETSVLDAELLDVFLRVCAIKAKQPDVLSDLRPGTVLRHRILVDRVREHLHSKLHEAFDLKSLAVAVGSSPFHLIRVFRAVMGMSPGTYHSRLRIGAAVDALLSRQPPQLSELAADLGYSSQSHMSRCFRQAVGSTPSQVRRVARTDSLSPPDLPVNKSKTLAQNKREIPQIPGAG